jgi:hypothetical protein
VELSLRIAGVDGGERWDTELGTSWSSSTEVEGTDVGAGAVLVPVSKQVLSFIYVCVYIVSCVQGVCHYRLSSVPVIID